MSVVCECVRAYFKGRVQGGDGIGGVDSRAGEIRCD